METKQTILLFICLTPMFTAMTCAMIGVIAVYRSITMPERKAKQVLLFYFSSLIVIWAGLLCNAISPIATVVIYTFFMLAFTVLPVLFYHFIYLITTRVDEHFSLTHYIAPFVYASIYLIWIGFIPYDVQFELAARRYTIVEGYKVFSHYFYSPAIVRFSLSVFYTLLMTIRLRNYYRKVQASPANTPFIAHKWLRLFILLASLLIFNALALVIAPPKTIYARILTGCSSLVITTQMIIIGLHSFDRRSLLFVSITGKVPQMNIPVNERMATDGSEIAYKRYLSTGDSFRVEAAPLTRKMFERFFVKPKRFLDPDIKMTDLLPLLHTNRSYLSTFINKEYGVHFNRYLNRLRLQELERLMKLPGNKGKPAIKLTADAGFPNYRAYQRAKKAEYVEDDNVTMETVNNPKDKNK